MTSLLAKVTADAAGIPGLGTLAGALLDRVRAHMAKAEEMHQAEQRARLNEFYANLLQGDTTMDEQVAQVMIDDRDFHALLRACVQDIEKEKVAMYATLARSLAMGKVGTAWRRHFILALKDLSADEAIRLRKAFVVNANDVKGMGMHSLRQEDFLDKGPPGSLHAIQIAHLVAKGFVDASKLTSLGEQFTMACWSEPELTPEALGYQVWTEERFVILCYDLDDEAIATFAMALENALHGQLRRAITRAIFGQDAKSIRLWHNRAILLVPKSSSRILEQAHALSEVTQRLPTVAVSLHADFVAGLNLPLVGVVPMSGSAEQIAASALALLKPPIR